MAFDEKPPREMLQRLDIQGYHDKTDGPEKLLLWVDVSIKAYRQVRMLWTLLQRAGMAPGGPQGMARPNAGESTVAT